MENCGKTAISFLSNKPVMFYFNYAKLLKLPKCTKPNRIR